ncbi:MAG: MerR family transcriptional regulator [Bryobacteraceae bacterium]|jgi:DNA-binding transcriptional MerR regulator
MLTVSRLARTCGLSRSTVLYYESIGLLKPARRSAGNYRVYGEKDAARLIRIRLWRESGLTLEDIRALLDQPDSNASAILKRRLEALSAEIERLRGHQHAIAALLGQSAFRRSQVVTKDKLVSIMRAAGLTETEMHRFHVEFEKSAPQEHQEFLEFLHIPADEVKSIREASRKG